MLKFVLISILISLLLYRLLGWLLRVAVWTLGQRAMRQQYEFTQHQARRRPGPGSATRREGEIRVDYVPKQPDRKFRMRRNATGVEDVDYEDIK